MSRRVSARLLALALFALLCWGAPPAHAGDDERPRANAGTRPEAQLKLLRKAADLARKEGRRELAAALEYRVRELERYLQERSRSEGPERSRSERPERGEARSARRVEGPDGRAEGRGGRGGRGGAGGRGGDEGRAPAVEHEVHVLREAMRILRARDADERLVRGLGEAVERMERSRSERPEQSPPHRGGRVGGRGGARSARRVEGRDDDDDEDERRALRHRVATIRMAVPMLRENGDARLVGILERAILTGDLMLAGREDDEARKAYERTPNLGELAEILHHAARLAERFKKHDRAERIMDLSRYYGNRWRQERSRSERPERSRSERPERSRSERPEQSPPHRGGRVEGHDEHIEELRRELHEVRRHLEELQRALEQLARRT